MTDMHHSSDTSAPQTSACLWPRQLHPTALLALFVLTKRTILGVTPSTHTCHHSYFLACVPADVQRKKRTVQDVLKTLTYEDLVDLHFKLQVCAVCGP
jgi:hypothetical protein